MIYLDNAATTRISEKALKVFDDFSRQNFYNPSAAYNPAFANAKLLDLAREKVLKRINASSGTVIFTSGATESNNLAILGSIREGNREYLFSSGEHPSVYNTAKHLESQKKTVKFIKLDESGCLDLDDLKKNVTNKTRLVSVMFVSNETGAINDIKEISRIVKSINPATLVHVDAVQGFCKIPINVTSWNIDFLTFSAHKFHGPKGVGGLYVKNKSDLKSINFGGGQEFNLRSGTINLPAVMSMVAAMEEIDVEASLNHVKKLKESFLASLDLNIVKYIEAESPYVISLSFPGVNGETLMRALEKDVIISTGSACSSKKAGNRILENMGFNQDYIKSSVRVSFDAGQTQDEVFESGKIIMEKYLELLEKLR